MKPTFIVFSNFRDAQSVQLQRRVQFSSWRFFEFMEQTLLAGFLENGVIVA